MLSKIKKLFGNDYVLSLFSKVYSIVIGVVSSAFYIRYLGLQYKGTYSYINEITTIIGLVINFGIYQSYPFFYRKHGNGIYKKYVDIFLLQFLIYLVIAMTIGIAFRNTNMVILYICIQLPFFVLKTQLDNVILVEKIKLYMWVDIGLKTILAIVYLLLWLLVSANIGYVVLTITITNLLVCVIYLFFSDYKISFDWIKPNVALIKEVTVFGFFPMLSALLMTLNYSVDIIFLKHMGDAVELSLYSVAAVLINYVWVLPNAFKDVLISKVARNDSEEQVAFSCRISMLITFICLIGFAIGGNLVVKVVFGSEFVGCYSVTILLFTGAFSMIYFKMLGVVFVAEKKQKEYFIILLISVVANVIANYLLIPIWGMYGAAFASITSYTICGISFLFRYCKWKNAKWKNYLVPKKEDFIPLIQFCTSRRK